MFSDQAIRLLRTTWKNAEELATELYAMFQATTLPLSHNAPIAADTRMQPDNTIPPIQALSGYDGPAIVAGNPSGALFGIGGDGRATSVDAEGNVKTKLLVDGMRLGIIVSGDGPIYQVLIQNDGFNLKPSVSNTGQVTWSTETVDKTQTIRIPGTNKVTQKIVSVPVPSPATTFVQAATLYAGDPSDPLPQGMQVMVLEHAGKYYLQVPVWL